MEYTHLGKWPGWDFALYVQREPKTMLALFHKVAGEVAKEQMPDLFMNHELMEVRVDIFVRITNCDVLSESIRDVRCTILRHHPLQTLLCTSAMMSTTWGWQLLQSWRPLCLLSSV